MFEIIGADNLSRLLLTKEDWKKHYEVKCRCLPRFEPRKEYEEMMAKVCFLAKEKVILDVWAKKSTKDEHSWGQKGQVLEAGTPRQRTEMTTLRMQRRFNDFCFVVKDILEFDNNRKIYTARRMPEVKWDEETPLWDYPENTVVVVPLTYKHWKGFYRRIDREGQGWIKHERVEQLVREFKIWLYCPIYFCKETQHVRQGAHRLEVARRIGDSTIRVRIMKTWWKKFDNKNWLDKPAMEDWLEGRRIKAIEEVKDDDKEIEGEGK